ncbi:hypothetical protein [Rothia sp. HMSC036D11]|jgi:hypothetical protein|uniref:hypothetical protein n=1 Tax=Rothia sp. HMSC036D11 TaxID=1739462 RepID=UPI0008A5C1F0|nr:hypothetical protein [Rothia sp. HMSC036D11]OFQ07859.1 hypothetical protein HMPREF2958_05205 [Rothia sp. HMSC036D11]
MSTGAFVVTAASDRVKKAIPSVGTLFTLITALLAWCVILEGSDYSFLPVLDGILRYLHVNVDWYSMVKGFAQLQGVAVFSSITLLIGTSNLAKIDVWEKQSSYSSTWIVLSLTLLALRGTSWVEWLGILIVTAAILVGFLIRDMVRHRQYLLEPTVGVSFSVFALCLIVLVLGFPLIFLWNVVSASVVRHVPQDLDQDSTPQPSGAIY